MKLVMGKGFYWFEIKSHPTMGAWIEIMIVMNLNLKTAVAPHDGCVD